ncbi:hypothetical protein HED60_13675 [Planctomycetales bacterium ZRK34]|nr:hypothetical protein HED60_13675 [Planctomycetales bacterium ZRK34]
MSRRVGGKATLAILKTPLAHKAVVRHIFSDRLVRAKRVKTTETGCVFALMVRAPEANTTAFGAPARRGLSFTLDRGVISRVGGANFQCAQTLIFAMRVRT